MLFIGLGIPFRNLGSFKSGALASNNSGGCGARPNAGDSRSLLLGVRRIEADPPHWLLLPLSDASLLLLSTLAKPSILLKICRNLTEIGAGGGI